MSKIMDDSVVSLHPLFGVDSEYSFDNTSTDVVFIIEGQPILAVKSLLIERNNVFKAMFSGNFKESKDNEVVIEGTTFQGFKTLILYLSYNQLVLKDNNDLDLIEEVYKLSDRYECPELLNRIIVHLNEITITFENFALISKIAFNYQMKELIEKVSKYFDDNIDYLINTVIDESQDMTRRKLLKVVSNKYQKVRSLSTKVRKRLNLLEDNFCWHCGRLNMVRRMDNNYNNVYDYWCASCESQLQLRYPDFESWRQSV